MRSLGDLTRDFYCVASAEAAEVALECVIFIVKGEESLTFCAALYELAGETHVTVFRNSKASIGAG
jgi:hypothetical protein